MATRGATPNNNGANDWQTPLTGRECDILALLADGLTNREVAAQLCLSEKTIRNRVSEILRKLGLHNRTQAAIWAREHGLWRAKR